MSFELGALVATPACLRFCQKHSVEILDLVRRHHSGDWGDLERDDKRANEQALTNGARIFSAYRVGPDKVWVITSATDDSGRRESTTCLLPSEY